MFLLFILNFKILSSFVFLFVKCPYGRIIIRTESSDIESIRSIIELVRLINSSTLQLSHLPITVQEDALSTYKLTEYNKLLNNKLYHI